MLRAQLSAFPASRSTTTGEPVQRPIHFVWSGVSVRWDGGFSPFFTSTRNVNPRAPTSRSGTPHPTPASE